MTYEQAVERFQLIRPKWSGTDKGYDTMVILLRKANNDKTKRGEMRDFFVTNLKKYLDIE